MSREITAYRRIRQCTEAAVWRDYLRAHQLLYYVFAESLLPDHVFDQLATDLELETAVPLEVGSDVLGHYHPRVRALAIMLRNEKAGRKRDAAKARKLYCEFARLEPAQLDGLTQKELSLL